MTRRKYDQVRESTSDLDDTGVSRAALRVEVSVPAFEAPVDEKPAQIRFKTAPGSIKPRAPRPPSIECFESGDYRFLQSITNRTFTKEDEMRIRRAQDVALIIREISKRSANKSPGRPRLDDWQCYLIWRIMSVTGWTRPYKIIQELARITAEERKSFLAPVEWGDAMHVPSLERRLWGSYRRWAEKGLKPMVLSWHEAFKTLLPLA